ncbi:MAG: DOPA 4,5-dioxygenase family protein [Erythrobacter sp.]|jgi:DOPA 4,5-dioxygenase|nr:DOPA 4,5-dioxygenase family protein [Erythrobacter sp.]
MAKIPSIERFHAHIYFDAEHMEHARKLAEAAEARFDLEVGRFHCEPVGPHPRGSVQLSMGAAVFGRFALWALEARGIFTIMAHGLTGDELVDHTEYVIWFGQSEPLDLSALD